MLSASVDDWYSCCNHLSACGIASPSWLDPLFGIFDCAASFPALLAKLALGAGVTWTLVVCDAFRKSPVSLLEASIDACS